MGAVAPVVDGKVDISESSQQTEKKSGSNLDKDDFLLLLVTQMQYSRLILNTLGADENFVDGIIRVYNNDICDTIDNYNCSAFYEPSYVIAKAYQNGGF